MKTNFRRISETIPMTIVSQARTPRRQLPEWLSADEVRGLLSVVADSRAKLLFQVEWRAGLRVSEALNLQVRDVNLTGSRPSLRVVYGKGGWSREVPVHDELGVVLEVYLSMIKDGPIFQNISRPTAHRRLKDAFAKARELMLVGPKRRLSNHVLRHSAARHWLANGVPINVVSAWLGHAHLETTMIYLEVLSDPNDMMGQVS